MEKQQREILEDRINIFQSHFQLESGFAFYQRTSRPQNTTFAFAPTE